MMNGMFSSKVTLYSMWIASIAIFLLCLSVDYNVGKSLLFAFLAMLFVWVGMQGGRDVPMKKGWHIGD